MSSGLSPVVCFLDEKLLPFFLRLWKQKSRDYLKTKTRQKTKELNHLALDVGRSRSDSMLPQRDPRKKYIYKTQQCCPNFCWCVVILVSVVSRDQATPQQKTAVYVTNLLHMPHDSMQTSRTSNSSLNCVSSSHILLITNAGQSGW